MTDNYSNLTLEQREEIGRFLGCNRGNKLKKSWGRFFIEFVVVCFAFIGFSFIAVYFSVNFHLTNADGILDKQTESFWESSKNTYAATFNSSHVEPFFNKVNYCSLKKLKVEFPGTFRRILDLALNGEVGLAQKNLDVALKNLMAVDKNISFCSEMLAIDITRKDFELLGDRIDSKNLFLFASSTEWNLFKTGVLKDKQIIKDIETKTGIKSRILVAELVAEQLRLFYSDRAWFEKMISPVKVLVSMSQFSWGVLGIKQETAVRIEGNLKNSNSVYYLGPEYEHILDFETEDVNQERFKRITSYRDHSYGYLYAAIYNKQIINQWQKEGFDISNRPEILATLYNIGFNGSKPNSDPQMGGAELNIEGLKYSFGRLAYEFYYSGELLEEFPQ
jgi:hypothetical protein